MNEEIREQLDEHAQQLAAMRNELITMKEQLSLAPSFSDAITEINVGGMGYSRFQNIVTLTADVPTASSLGIIQASASITGGSASTDGQIDFTTDDHETDITVLDADKDNNRIVVGLTAIYSVHFLGSINVIKKSEVTADSIAKVLKGVTQLFSVGVSFEEWKTASPSTDRTWFMGGGRNLQLNQGDIIDVDFNKGSTAARLDGGILSIDYASPL